MDQSHSGESQTTAEALLEQSNRIMQELDDLDAVLDELEQAVAELLALESLPQPCLTSQPKSLNRRRGRRGRFHKRPPIAKPTREVSRSQGITRNWGVATQKKRKAMLQKSEIVEAELLEAFARLQAHEDARVLIQELLQAATLPSEHLFADLAGDMANRELLLAGIRIRLASILGRLEIGQRRAAKTLYAASYQQEMLRSMQRELLVYLAGAYQGLVHEESQPAARRVLGVVENLLQENMSSNAPEEKPTNDAERSDQQRWFKVRVLSEGEESELVESYCEKELLRRYPRLAPLLASPDFTGCHWQVTTQTGWEILQISLED